MTVTKSFKAKPLTTTPRKDNKSAWKEFNSILYHIKSEFLHSKSRTHLIIRARDNYYENKRICESHLTVNHKDIAEYLLWIHTTCLLSIQTQELISLFGKKLLDITKEDGKWIDKYRDLLAYSFKYSLSEGAIFKVIKHGGNHDYKIGSTVKVYKDGSGICMYPNGEIGNMLPTSEEIVMPATDDEILQYVFERYSKSFAGLMQYVCEKDKTNPKNYLTKEMFEEIESLYSKKAKYKEGGMKISFNTYGELVKLSDKMKAPPKAPPAETWSKFVNSGSMYTASLTAGSSPHYYNSTSY